MKGRQHRAGKQRNACPTGKIRYRDRQSALQVIHGAKSGSGAGAVAGRKIPIRAYECATCKGWHLTSQADRFA